MLCKKRRRIYRVVFCLNFKKVKLYLLTVFVFVIVKLFVNRPALGFEDVADVEPAQTCVLTDTDLEKELKLKVVKFGAVNSLHLFIEGPDGSDHVTVNSLAFFGQVTQGVADYSKLKHSHGEDE
jgi:hypothetical protein